jgi:DNA-3-methyladenine glycosylase II
MQHRSAAGRNRAHEQSPAEQQIAATDARMAALLACSARYNIQPGQTVQPFEALAESIVYQQLSGKAAAKIWSRVRALYPSRRRLDPAAVLITADEKFRAAGLSASKTRALKDLAAKTIDGTVPPARHLARMSDEEIIARLTTVRGIGIWTVHMLLLFDLGRPDVWPHTDYGIRKGVAKIFDRRKLPTPKQLLRIGEQWRPYRSVAAWYFWRALDQMMPRSDAGPLAATK